MTTRVGMVAGEPSGDLLAARILQGLTAQQTDIVCEGIGGPEMLARGFQAWHPMAALSVFGYVDALKQLPRLVSTYLDTKNRWLRQPPDVFVGIDAPDFNLRLEAQLRKAGIPTIHFVGPSIWAWRYERIHKIRDAVSHMLVLFPFEEAIYQKEGIPVTYVGHPLARVIPMHPDKAGVRARLGIAPDARVLALMPGSRGSEVRLLAPRFIEAVRLLQQRDPDLHVLVPMVNAERRKEFEGFLASTPLRNCRVLMHPAGAGPDPAAQAVDQHNPADPTRPVAWDAMEAADAVLVASGTATLEAALFKRPMVISYVLSPMMRRIMAWKSGQERPLVPWVGLPNVLAQEFLVPELLQDDATPEKLADATWKALTDTAYRSNLKTRYTQMHATLNRDTAGLATKVILDHIA
ncbi:MAG TPA: lipid-A-disaccharide synthase [Burkholderiaceae bacterium]|nr:lipid-A-disaccharide synthase [Burkholderiaceae bacterium]